MTIAQEKNPPVKLPNEPTITPQIVAEHGLAPDEYDRLLKIMGRTPTMVELGIFSANCDGGLTMSLAPERWKADWDDIVAMCRIADDAGLEFILPVAKWRGYQGKANIYGKSIQAQNLELDAKEFDILVHKAHSEIILVDLQIDGDGRPARLAAVRAERRPALAVGQEQQAGEGGTRSAPGAKQRRQRQDQPDGQCHQGKEHQRGGQCKAQSDRFVQQQYTKRHAKQRRQEREHR